MSDNTYSTVNQQYSIDKSQHKYSSRYARLMNILFYAKEIPSDLYVQMNMSYVNFRKTISILKQRGWIKKIHRDSAIGYVLTANGRKQTRFLDYMRYRDCLENETRQYDIKRRNRKRQFAYLYALLDRVGISYESFAKPPITDATVNDERVCFYTALDFKRMLGIEANPFKGSRLLGVLIGRGQVIPVYRTSNLLKTFGRHEVLVPEFMLRYFSVRVDTAILICNGEESVVNISKQIIENESSDYKVGVNTAHYKHFYILPSDDSFLSRLENLYSDHSDLMQRLIEQNEIETTDRDEDGKYRLKIGTGFYRDNPVWLCPGNINVVTLRLFIYNAERSEKRNYIFCQERDLAALKEITRNTSIWVGPIREG